MIKTILSQVFFWLALLMVASTTFFIALIHLPFDSFYWSELLEAFWFQYGLVFVAAFICLLIAFILNARKTLTRSRSFIVLAFLSIAGAAYILTTVQQDFPWFPFGTGDTKPVPLSTLNTIRILQHNAFWYQVKNDGVARLIKNTPADIVALEEVDGDNLGAIEKVSGRYPYRAGGSGLGLLLLSRWPIESSKVVEPYPGYPSLVSYVRLPDGRRLSVVVVHPPHATEPYTFKVQKDVFDSLVALKAELKPPVVLLGDVNATPFNKTLIRFKKEMGLVNPRDGIGYLSTWPSYLPWFARIPIDHILVSPDLKPLSLELKENTGSDHLPLYLVVK